ncbi:MAG TPA: hypothetical protein VF605_11290 [Allosphingosinicella sp.]|jgi:hypothetical protein
MTDINMNASSRSRSARTVAVDNFLRKTLRVGDPRNPDEIAKALLDRYPGEADRARREREGLAHSSLPELTPAALMAGVAATAELAQAQDDLERDAQALVTSSQLKDIRIELSGWGRAVRRIADEGLAAARLALDAVQFDRALAARSQLGSYARLARYVGTLTDGAGGAFRRLAQSCDSLAGLILVAIGEGLAAAGITRGTSLVRVAAGELQSRRNAVVNALRSLAGSTEASFGVQEWPRGLESYRRLIRRLDVGGEAELRALIEESSLSAAMDDLVDLSAGANIGGLRELSTASALLLARFQRLIRYCQSVAIDDVDMADNDSPESPALAAFSSALQLFVDAFSGTGGGSRLLYVARPPIVIYGLYGAAGADAGAARLMKLTIARGALAEQIDCLSGCECDEGALRCQILADFLLFLIDRSIDAYAVGNEAAANGDPEKRAATYGHLIETALGMVGGEEEDEASVCGFSPALTSALADLADELLFEFDLDGPPFDSWTLDFVVPELQMLYFAEGHVERLVRSLSASCHSRFLFDGFTSDGETRESFNRSVIREALKRLNSKPGIADGISMPATLETSLATLASGRSDRRN